MAKRGKRTAKRTPKKSKRSAAKRAAASRGTARRTARPAASRPKKTKKPAAKSTRRAGLRPLRPEETVPTPPSSLNLKRNPSAARSGRVELRGARRKLGAMNAVTGGDVDVDAQDAYFTGEEAPGGDNPTPDQDVVDEIGKAIGLEYQDDEELKSGDKLEKRDKHRWELDPASSEDYKERK